MLLKKENFNMHLLGFCFFLLNVYPSYMFYNLNTYKILMVMIALVILFVADIYYFKVNKNFAIEKWQIKSIGILSLFTLLLLPGVVWHGGFWNYYLPNELDSNLVSLGLSFALLLRVKTTKDFIILIDWMAVSVIYAFIFAFIEKMGFNVFMWTPVEGEGHRTSSTYGNPNYLAGCMAITIPLLFFMLLSRFQQIDKFKKPSLKTVFYFVTVLLGMMTINMTGTRSALGATLFAIALGLAVYFLVYDKILKRKQKFIMLFIFLIPFVGFIVFDLLTGMSFITRLSGLTSTVTWSPRLSPWMTALKSIADSPVVGYGIGSSYTLFFEYVNPDIRFVSGERSFSHAHSEVLELFQEGGLILLIFYIVFWFFLIKKLYEVARKHDDLNVKIVSFGLIFSFIAYFIQGNVDVAPRMMSVKVPYYLLTMLAFILYFKFFKKEEGRINLKYEKLYFLLNPVYILFTVVLMYGWFYSMYYYTEFLKNPRKGVTEVKVLEDVIKKYTNVYATEAIARQHYIMGNWETAYNYMLQIDKIIPHFRETDFYKSQVLKQLKRLDDAKKEALIYQQRDYYLTPNLQFLMNFAIEENDFEFYKKEVVYLIKKLIVDASVYHHSAFDSDLEIVFLNTDNFSLSVEPRIVSSGSLIKIGEPFLRKIFDELVHCRNNPCDNNHIGAKRMELYNAMVQTKYFHKFYKKQVDQNKGVMLDQDIHNYMALENSFTQQRNQLDREVQMSQMIPDSSSRISKIVKLLEMRDKLNDEYQKRSNTIKVYLDDYFDFDSFYKRLKLAMNYVDSMYLSAINYRFQK